MKNLFHRAAAAAFGLAISASASWAGSSLYGDEGVIIVPAAVSSSTDVDASAIIPDVSRGQVVAYDTQKPRGSILVSTRKNELYFVLGHGQAIKYRVATAKKGFEWAGTHKVSRKAVWPSWSPPAEMRARRPDLPAFMAGGPKNPLGARAIYLGSSIYRIHGTNEPKSIGKAASSGCIRMLNDDVAELYRLVRPGAEVTVY